MGNSESVFSFIGLWRHGDFLRLWSGQTVSAVGSQITFLALPLTAILLLGASPTQMGILAAAGSIPSLLVGVPVGVWVDRRKRRPILILSSLGRAVLLLAIPAAAGLDVLRIEYLYALALSFGTLSLFFTLGYQSLLPWLVDRDDLVEANSKMAITRSAAELVGPGVAGFLIQLATAPVALIVDAVSFLVSALAIRSIRATEPEPIPPEHPEVANRFLREVRQGLAFVIHDRVLTTLTGHGGTLSLFNSMLEAVWMLYLINRLGMNPSLLGVVFSVGGAGFLVGALISQRVVSRLGVGRSILLGSLLLAASDLVTPLTGGPLVVIVVSLMAASFSFGIGLTIYNVGSTSLRQAATPDRYRGRVNSVAATVEGGVVPVGALLGGALGQGIGLRPTLFIAVAGELLSAVWLLLSPVLGLRRLPEVK